MNNMTKLISRAGAALSLLWICLSHAQSEHHEHHPHQAQSAHHDHAEHRGHQQPDANTPAGVMTDHLHARGDTMVALRYQRVSSSGYYQGGERVGAQELAAAGYTMMASDMTMDMFMLDLMYTPTDKISLMLMPHFMRMDMTMEATGAMPMDGHGDGHHGHDMGAGHSVSGIGDTLASVLFELAAGDRYQLLASAGLSIPTGSVSKKHADGHFVHYSMQPGSGTWDLVPSLTYKGSKGVFGWGAQLNGRFGLESRNDSGYARGDRYGATAWSSVRLAPWVSISARLAYEQQDSISGHYNGPHNHSSPADRQENYGGEYVDAGLGANLVVREGGFAGLRLNLEWTTRVNEDYNGFQLGQDQGVNATASFATLTLPTQSTNLRR